MGMMVSVCNRVRGLRRKLHKGQTMTEYALILAAIAVVVFVTYEVMGQDIGSMVSKVNSSLTSS
jgi:Flp pilus assembly pilin Flp